MSSLQFPHMQGSLAYIHPPEHLLCEDEFKAAKVHPTEATEGHGPLTGLEPKDRKGSGGLEAATL